MQLLHRRRTEHDLINSIHAMARQQGRTHGGVSGGREYRYRRPVDLHVWNAVARPRPNVGIGAEQTGGLRWYPRATIHRVVPVPAVKRGMRDERVETTAERQRGH